MKCNALEILEIIGVTLNDVATALETGGGGQCRFDTVDALDIVDVSRVDGRIEHLEAQLSWLEISIEGLGKCHDIVGLAKGCEGGGGEGHGCSKSKCLMDQKFHC